MKTALWKIGEVELWRVKCDGFDRLLIVPLGIAPEQAAAKLGWMYLSAELISDIPAYAWLDLEKLIQ